MTPSERATIVLTAVRQHLDDPSESSGLPCQCGAELRRYPQADRGYRLLCPACDDDYIKEIGS